MRQWIVVLIVLMFISNGCASDRIIIYGDPYSYNGFTATATIMDYFSNEALQKLADADITCLLVSYETMKVVVSARRGTNFIESDAMVHGCTLTSRNKDGSIVVDGILISKTLWTSLENMVVPTTLIHEHLHAYWYLYFTDEERARWTTALELDHANMNREMRLFGQWSDEHDVLTDPNETFARFGASMIRERILDPDHYFPSKRVPQNILDCYRGILRDEFLNADPQVASH